MIAVIGMTSNFIAEMVTAKLAPSEVLVGTLSVVSQSRLHNDESSLTAGIRSALRFSTAPSRLFSSWTASSHTSSTLWLMLSSWSH